MSMVRRKFTDQILRKCVNITGTKTANVCFMIQKVPSSATTKQRFSYHPPPHHTPGATARNRKANAYIHPINFPSLR